jgi:hypothetical protein
VRARREQKERGAALAALTVLTVAFSSRAAPPDAAAEERPAELQPANGSYLHLFGALALGKGIRFNNPYRLATPLGDDAESLSTTATYVDASIGATGGDPEGLQHGVSFHISFAVTGIPQEVVTPSYVALYRFPPRFFAYGRAGLPVILEPDANVGYELALGGAYLVTAGIGATAELVGDLFYGAATQDEAVTTIPVLSFQLGVLVDFEVLP